MTDKDEDSRHSEPQPWWQDSVREFAPYVGLGIQLAGAVLLFFFIGWWVDGSYGTSPWGKLIGVLIGAAGGMLKFIRTVTEPGFGSGPKDSSKK